MFGVRLSRIHHATFEAHPMGVDPKFRLHVSERLVGQQDGPMLTALTRLNGGRIYLPNGAKERADRDGLAVRFERFKRAAPPADRAFGGRLPPARGVGHRCRWFSGRGLRGVGNIYGRDARLPSSRHAYPRSPLR